MKIISTALAIILAVIGVGWLGLRAQAAPFVPYTARTPVIETVPLPEGLPAPVERFYRLVYGERVPVITSVVMSGQARLRPFGPFYLPARFRFTHIAGKDYRHYIETTFFDIPFMKVNESYIDGHARMELPFATDEGLKLNQAAALGMWAEAFWFPAILVTDSRVHWEVIDENTAGLSVPFEDGQEHFIVRFDPQSGLVTWIEAMRYHDSHSPVKVLWLNQTTAWGERDGRPVLTTGLVTWMDDGKPWATFTVEEIVYNSDVKDFVRAKGP